MSPPPYSDNDYTKGTAVIHWLMAAVMTGGVFFLAWQLAWPWVFDVNDPAFNPMLFLFGFLIIATVYEVFVALRWSSRLRRFGGARMELSNRGNIRLGERFEGRILTAKPLTPDGDWHILLRCIDRYSPVGTAPHSSESDLDMNIPWQKELIIPAAALNTANGIPFAFQLPKSVGPEPNALGISTGSPYFKFRAAVSIPGFRRQWAQNVAPNARSWQLDVSAQMPGTDFHAQFIVPVMPG